MGATITHQGTVRLGTVDVAYVLKRVSRRRHVHFLINDTGAIEVRAPQRFHPSEVQRILHENTEWVMQALENARAQQARRLRLVTGARLPLLDESLCLDIRPQPQPQSHRRNDARPQFGRVERRGAMLCVSAASLEDDALRWLIENWYRREAATHLSRRVAHYALRLKVRAAKVAIRGQRTRWGSCSSKGTVSLNWRLIMVPAELADYVVVHEVCHLKHMDHSPRFWAMVAGIIPDYQRCRNILNTLHDRLPL